MIFLISLYRSVHSSSKSVSSQNDLVCASRSSSLHSESIKCSEGEGVYTVPIDVLQNITKDFTHLETELDKSNEVCSEPSIEQGKRNQHWLPPNSTQKINVADSRKSLRIKSIRTIKASPSDQSSFGHQLEDVPPPGTVARVEIRTDRARNKTIFTILPALPGVWMKGGIVSEPHSFTVNTCNLSEATKLIKPLHLERLPILRDIFQASVKASESKRPESNKEHSQEAQRKDIFREEDFNKSVKNNSLQLGDNTTKSNDTETSTFETPRVSVSPVHELPGSKRVIIDDVSNDSSLKSSYTCGKNIIHGKKVEEDEFLRELITYGIHYDSIAREDSKKRTENEGSIKCNSSWMCPEKGCVRHFPKLSKLKLHIFSHRNVRPYKCDKPGCEWAFHTASKLKRHQGTIHIEKDRKVKYECKLEKCVEKVASFSNSYNLNQHLKRHARPLKYKCSTPGCEAAFQTKLELKSHEKSSIHRSLILQNLESTTASMDSMEKLIMLPEHICYHCHKRFYNSKDLIKHINKFHNGEPTDMKETSSASTTSTKQKYSCTFENCFKVFEQPSRLAAHVRIHTGEKPYPCTWPTCGWSFRNASKLRRHELTHKNERKHTCSICAKSYFRPEHLRSHILAIHNPSGKPERFVCPLDKCGKRFSARSTLYVHMKRHAGEELPDGKINSSHFRCVIESCDERFYDRNELRSHVSLHHVQELAESAAGGLSSPLESQEMSSMIGVSQLSVVASDQETVAAAAELDFIALLSSVGDVDEVNVGMSSCYEEQSDTQENVKEKVSSNSINMAANQAGGPNCNMDVVSYVVHGEINEKETIVGKDDKSSTPEIKTSEDQIISEMIIETLTSSSTQGQQNNIGLQMESNCIARGKDGEKERVQYLNPPIFSSFLSKGEKCGARKNHSCEVLITPFEEPIVQEESQGELITVDASAITPIKLVGQNGTHQTSSSTIQKDTSQMFNSSLINSNVTTYTENIQLHCDIQRKHKIEEIQYLSDPSKSATTTLEMQPSLSNVKTKVDCGQEISHFDRSNDVRKAEKVLSFPKDTQQTASSILNSRIESNNLTNKEYKITHLLSSDLIFTDKKSTLEKKRPSILRRDNSMSASNSIPLHYKCQSNEGDITGMYDEHIGKERCSEEVPHRKKRSPKKQKLMNTTLDNLISDEFI